MKTIKLKSLATVAGLLAAMTLGVQQLQAQDFGGNGFGQGPGMFLDENGDGINDLAPDADGDGIPNGMDDDYVRPADGVRFGQGPGMFLDENGDGINDLAPDADGDGIPNGMDDDYVRLADGSGFSHRHGAGMNGGRRGAGGFGPGDGTGFNRMGPADGTGFGPGDCTGDGTLGTFRRGPSNR